MECSRADKAPKKILEWKIKRNLTDKLIEDSVKLNRE